ncbi:MAG: hypothetical protein R3C11_20600 [Planctomycetaceae bacterium]
MNSQLLRFPPPRTYPAHSRWLLARRARKNNSLVLRQAPAEQPVEKSQPEAGRAMKTL